MSDRNLRRDAGFTLPEVLVSVLITGVLVAALASAVSLMVGQTKNNQGRLANSRSEQSVGMWLPSDLASAEQVDTTPSSVPCTGNCPPGIDLGGSNALMLTWTGSVAGTTEAITTTTTVSYRYVQNGDEFEIVRVLCESVGGAAPTCSQVVVLHDVPAPPVGQTWQPGVTAPTWVMLVGLATDPSDPTGSVALDPTFKTKNGRKVTVTINGGGTAAGGGGGQDVITLSAGGTDRVSNLATSNLTDAPTFAATRSRCGGNFGMVVDTSGSIGSTNMASVRTGITAFVNTFAGTPIKLQIVRFSTNASTLGAGSGWSRYYDMLNESDVADLKTQVGLLSSSGYTNYEDALFRMFENSDGTVQSTLPDTLIFFTDGIPNYTRLNSTTGTAAAVANADDSGLPAPGGTTSNFNQVAFNRAYRIARQFDADVSRFIGVFVGADTALTSQWLTQGAGYHLTNFLRGYHTDYQYASSGLTYQYASTGVSWQYATTGVDYQKQSGTKWSSVSWSTYAAGNTNNTSSDGYRIVVTGTPSGWTTISGTASQAKTTYDTSNVDNTTSDGLRVSVTGTPSGWTSIGTTSTAKALYDKSNSVAGGTDGYQVSVTGSLTGWTSTTQAYHDLNNTTSDATDGFQLANVYSSPYNAWETTTETAYNSGNTSWGATDGWDATKVYALPYTYHEAYSSSTIANTDILGRLITVGTPVPAAPTGGPYTNAAVADLYVLPNWTQFAGALDGVALAECGGTVTVQTRIGAAAAADPFTYQNSVDLKTATTSSQYRSGTFDYDLSGGKSVTATITPMNLSSLNKYVPVSWSCKSAGVDYPFTSVPIAGTAWSSIRLTVTPNQAISCIQSVALK